MLTSSPISTNVMCKLSGRWVYLHQWCRFPQRSSAGWEGAMFLDARWLCGSTSFNHPQSENMDRRVERDVKRKPPDGLWRSLWPSPKSNVKTQRTQTVGRSQITLGVRHKLPDFLETRKKMLWQTCFQLWLSNNEKCWFCF